MLAALKSEIAYLRGLLRVVKATKPVTAVATKTLGDHLDEWVGRSGDNPALANETESLTYRQLGARSNAYARWAVSQGLGKGDAVALIMPNRPEYLAIWFGLARVGVATALINTNLTGPSLVHSLKSVNARAAIVDRALASAFATARADLTAKTAIWSHGDAGNADSRIDLAVDRLSGEPLAASERRNVTIDDTAVYIYTSGTTGLPKAARITHSRALRVMYGFGAALGARPDDRSYMVLPMYHSNGGLIAPGLVLPYGGSGFIRERFSARAFWSDSIAQNCTTFVYIGELCRYLLNAPPTDIDRAHGIRACIGNGLRPDIFAAFQARFGVRNVLEFYAATEGNAVMMNFDSRPGAIGRIPKWATNRFPVKVVAYDHDANAPVRDALGRCRELGPDEIGELLAEIRDDPKMPAARFDGYADPKATQQKVLRDAFKPGDTWFRTGDLVKQDSKGYFYFVDRIGDTFRWKGENVSTTEVAETLQQFPGVQEAVVYGVAVSRHDGRAGMAALVVDTPATFDLDGLHAFLAERLPAYARPMFLRFRSQIEVTGTFKQRKVDLVAEGFDTRRVGDPVYFDDRARSGYGPVRDDWLAGLESGEVRL
jgi:fatty-acyl-CoA synthase